jgi:hypothetical protein
MCCCRMLCAGADTGLWMAARYMFTEQQRTNSVHCNVQRTIRVQYVVRCPKQRTEYPWCNYHSVARLALTLHRCHPYHELCNSEGAAGCDCVHHRSGTPGCLFVGESTTAGLSYQC